MRSTQDLVNELAAEVRKFTVKKPAMLMLAIAVGFENDTQFVFHNDHNPLEKLDELLNQGGEPVGLIGFVSVTLDDDTSQGQGTLICRPFSEYANESWVDGYLGNLANNVRSTMLSHPGFREAQGQKWEQQ